MRRIKANGISIGVDIAGEGPWLIFSHSLGCRKEMWRPQIDAFAATHRVLTYDTRGHGDSDAPPGPYLLETLAQDVVALCAALDIRKCHFVGLSMGGMIGQMLALNAPDLLLSLTLANTSSFYGPAALANWAARRDTALSAGMAALVTPSLDRWFTPTFRATHPDALHTAAQWLQDANPQGYAACCMAIAAIDTTARLNEIDVPVLVIAGADDVATPPSLAQVMHAEISDSRLRVLAGAAHISSVEQAEAFNRVLGKFLSGALPNEQSNVRPADSRRAVCIEVPIEAPKEA